MITELEALRKQYLADEKTYKKLCTENPSSPSIGREKAELELVKMLKNIESKKKEYNELKIE